MRTKPILFIAIFLPFLIFSFPMVGFSEINTPPIMSGVDMLGSDYRNQQVGGNNPNTCFNMCKRDSKCLAWTHVKPNIQGPKSVCWFKNVIPKPKTNNCCTSGWINPLYNFQACRSIGNTTGSRPATCIGEGGRNFGKAGKTFKKGDRVMLLTNFKRLPKGQKKLVFVYQKKKNGKFVNFSNNKKRSNSIIMAEAGLNGWVLILQKVVPTVSGWLWKETVYWVKF